MAQKLKSYAIIALGSVIYALAFDWFVAPNQIAMGGVAGLAQIVNALLPILPVGVLTIVINVPLFLAGWRLLGGHLLVTSLFAMAHDLLEFDYAKIQVPEGIDKSDYQDLFDDIMDAGIFGQSSSERIHSATITLNTISDGKTSVLKSIFPSLKEMQGKYKYLNKYPVLLPFAYLSRIVNYKKNNSSKNSQRTIEVGKQRIELLKKYRVIK